MTCNHATSRWGRCADCGMTWAAQAAQIATATAAPTEAARQCWCGHMESDHQGGCIQPATVNPDLPCACTRFDWWPDNAS